MNPVWFENNKKYQDELKSLRKFRINPNDICHIVITHFNINLSKNVGHTGREYKRNWQKPILKQGIGKKWMQQRTELFDQICYPSMLNQTNQNFEWFTFFDKDTTDIKSYRKYNRMHPMLIPYKDPFRYQTHIIQNLLIDRGIKKKWFIFTKLDNDDALNKTFIDRLQNIWLPYCIKHNREFSMVCFTSGVMALKRPDGKSKLMTKEDRYGPFVNTIEKFNKDYKKFKTCWHSYHTTMHDKAFPESVVRYTDKSDPMWFIYDHEFNLCDRDPRLKEKTDYTGTEKDLIERFNINPKYVRLK